MFTGIIEDIGSVNAVIPQGPATRIQIVSEKILEDLEIDQSVSVNGVCLTVIEKGSNFFSSDVVSETLERTTLKQIKKYERVNLERALRLQDRLGGHLVLGHIDGIGVIQQISYQTQRNTMVLEIPIELACYVIAQGSVAIDGVSLTIYKKDKNIVTVAIIPHTMRQTIFQYKNSGDQVNIEVDFFAKYIEQFMIKSGETKITWEWLKQKGY